jgi:hypothetical protein
VNSLNHLSGHVEFTVCLK